MDDITAAWHASTLVVGRIFDLMGRFGNDWMAKRNSDGFYAVVDGAFFDWGTHRAGGGVECIEFG